MYLVVKLVVCKRSAVAERVPVPKQCELLWVSVGTRSMAFTEPQALKDDKSRQQKLKGAADCAWSRWDCVNVTGECMMYVDMKVYVKDTVQ